MLKNVFKYEHATFLDSLHIFVLTRERQKKGRFRDQNNLFCCYYSQLELAEKYLYSN